MIEYTIFIMSKEEVHYCTTIDIVYQKNPQFIGLILEQCLSRVFSTRSVIIPTDDVLKKLSKMKDKDEQKNLLMNHILYPLSTPESLREREYVVTIRGTKYNIKKDGDKIFFNDVEIIPDDNVGKKYIYRATGEMKPGPAEPKKERSNGDRSDGDQNDKNKSEETRGKTEIKGGEFGGEDNKPEEQSKEQSKEQSNDEDESESDIESEDDETTIDAKKPISKDEKRRNEEKIDTDEKEKLTEIPEESEEKYQKRERFREQAREQVREHAGGAKKKVHKTRHVIKKEPEPQVLQPIDMPKVVDVNEEIDQEGLEYEGEGEIVPVKTGGGCSGGMCGGAHRSSERKDKASSESFKEFISKLNSGGVLGKDNKEKATANISSIFL